MLHSVAVASPKQLEAKPSHVSSHVQPSIARQFDSADVVLQVQAEPAHDPVDDDQ